MGGDIDVDSAAGHGARSWLTVRAEPVAEQVLPAGRPAAEPPPAEAPAPARQASVLLVEDHPISQDVAREMLELLGYKVSVVGNGRAAVDRVAQERFDVVFMDCQMPGMDGYAATRAIRAAEQDGPHVPVIALTANAMPGDRERCLAAGMDDYLAKPFRLADLDAVARRWTAGTGSSKPASPA